MNTQNFLFDAVNREAEVQSDLEDMNEFMTFRRSEADALKPTAFEIWADKVEKILGHDLDGDQDQDGYSLDFASDAFDRGESPEHYVAKVREAKGAIRVERFVARGKEPRMPEVL